MYIFYLLIIYTIFEIIFSVKLHIIKRQRETKVLWKSVENSGTSPPLFLYAIIIYTALSQINRAACSITAQSQESEEKELAGLNSLRCSIIPPFWG